MRTRGSSLTASITMLSSFIAVACVMHLLVLMTSSKVPTSQVLGTRDNWLDTEQESFRAAMLLRPTTNYLSDRQYTGRAVSVPKSAVVTPKISVQMWFKRKEETVSYIEKTHHPLLPQTSISNSNICRNKSVDILIYVHSLWSNFQRRRALRETWANPKVFRDITIRTVFVLGKPQNEADQIRINNENLVHHDILQGDFKDSFSNLSLKSVLMLHWLNKYCQHARYIMKADDDIFVNIFSLVENYISRLWDKNRTIMCHFIPKHTNRIVRDLGNRWYIPKDILKDTVYYPQFCSGYAVLFTSDLVPLLYGASYRAPFITVDDAYTFGILTQNITDVKYIDIQKSLTLNQDIAMKQYSVSGSLTFVGATAWQEGKMTDLWNFAIVKLSKWAKQHANIAVLQERISKMRKTL